MNNIVFFIGPLAVHWYGVILSIAILIGIYVSILQARLFGLSASTIVYLALSCVMTGLLASHMFFVFTNWHLYSNNLMELLLLRHGGLAIHGALFGILLTIYIYTFISRMPFGLTADVLTPGLAITQAIGQWSNFVNQEAFGYPTNVSWGIYIDFAYRPLGYQQYDFFHPTFLYESGLAFFLFLIAIIYNLLARKRSDFISGGNFLLYIFIYSAGRLVIESFRIDSEIFYGVRLAQLMSILIMAIVVVIWLYKRWMGGRQLIVPKGEHNGKFR